MNNLFLTLFLINTAGGTCVWNFNFFKAEYNTYFGHGFEEEFAKKIYIRTIYLLNIYKTFKENGIFTKFLWFERYYRKPESYKISNDTLYIRSLKDTLLIKKIFKEVFNIEIKNFKRFEKKPFYVFSLHIKCSNDPSKLKDILIRDTVFNCYARDSEESDKKELFIYACSDYMHPLSFYQHEKDGYWHLYTGFYLKLQNVKKAKKIWERYFKNVSIVSFPLTYRYIAKYLGT